VVDVGGLGEAGVEGLRLLAKGERHMAYLWVLV
jgi:hypothetical protein